MFDKHYIGEIGTVVEVDCGVDIRGATVTNLLVTKPGGTIVTWTASIYGTNKLRYTIQEGDLDEDGTYALQSYIEISGWKGRGVTASFTIVSLFS